MFVDFGKMTIGGNLPRLSCGRFVPDYIGQLISLLQTAAVFYVLAFGLIVRWWSGMYWQYRRVVGA